MSPDGVTVLKIILLGFWMLYFAAIAASNGLDVLSRRSTRASVHHFRAHNLEEVETAIVGVGGSKGLAHAMFAFVLIAQCLGGLAFAGAFVAALGATPLAGFTSVALLWNVGMWQAFLLADTVCKTYQFTVIHTATLCAALITLAFFLP